MPIYSLTEEKVEEIQKQMNEKRNEYKALAKKSIHDLWNEDLDNFEEELTKYEEKEEADRVQIKGVKNDGKRKRKAPARKKK